MAFRMTIGRKLFLSHFLAVLLVSGSIGSYFYFNASQSVLTGLQDRLKYSAAFISRTIDATELKDIHAESDISSPAYVRNLKKLRDFRRMNPDIAYLYIMRRIGEKVLFVIDSDETEDQALPGQEYTDLVPTLLQGFTGLSVDDTIYTDQWGAFLSGYSPIKNGMGEFLVGIDMRALEVQEKFGKLRLSGIISLICSVLLALLFSRYLASRFTVPINLLIARCRFIAEGRLDDHVAFRTNDELDNLIVAFNSMSTQLESSEKKKIDAYEALRKARDELEVRVQQRTQDLEETNGKLSKEIAERIHAEKALEEAAMTDPLTGILNRRAMMGYLGREIARNQRDNTNFVILLADMDHFKDINDTYGHDVGDRVLIETATRFKNIIRGQDTVARWGGEEFLILLPDTGLEGGLMAAEKVRGHIADEPYVTYGKNIHITLSIGVAAFRPDQPLDDCIKAADTALYKAKHCGRNRVECSSID
ncbi:MAG TPA: diguanylate cyclase [Syntrophales bacterium]|nr:diguanylate cyclase [Syntrophales bacterium]HPQ43702.1 diguanylate cyclase [Syntrophales bacterium]